MYQGLENINYWKKCIKFMDNIYMEKKCMELNSGHFEITW